MGKPSCKINRSGIKYIFITMLFFSHLKIIMDENREMLTALDSVMGDGDLGITMQIAFKDTKYSGVELNQTCLPSGRLSTLNSLCSKNRVNPGLKMIPLML